MIRNINKDIFFLGLKSKIATKDDKQIAIDLIDTLKANENICVGLAANMIGFNKNIIFIKYENSEILMYNPLIIEKKDDYYTTEGCLSLVGERSTIRFNEITVEYEDINFFKKIIKLTGFVAQIAQHEIDHCNGIVI